MRPDPRQRPHSSRGAALAAIHPIARAEHPLGLLWRQRLSLSNAAAVARQVGRTEDEADFATPGISRATATIPDPAGGFFRPGAP